MTSPFVRRSTAITAGAVVFAGLVAAPIAAFAADARRPGRAPRRPVTVTADPDGAGQLYTLTDDVSTYTTITMPNDATLDGAGHTITAVEDATHRNFPGSVLASAVGSNSAPAKLDVKNLDITTQGFEGGSNSGGLLNGIYMYRAGGSLTNVSVNGISHGNGVQEGNAISIRNRVAGRRHQRPARPGRPDRHRRHELPEDRSAPRRQPDLHGQERPRGPGRGPAGPAQPDHRGQLPADLPRRVRLGHRQHVQAQQPRAGNGRAPVQRQEGRLRSSHHRRRAPATTGINVSNASNTIDTTFTMRGGAVTGTATACRQRRRCRRSGNPGTVSRHADRHQGHRLEHGHRGRASPRPPPRPRPRPPPRWRRST